MAESADRSTIRVESVEWDDPSAVARRAAMEAEMRIRCADRLGLRAAPIFAPYELQTYSLCFEKVQT